ncbi:MAG: hypothetical protein ACR2NB_00475 [Solirubrobacteraceae bacterium]
MLEQNEARDVEHPLPEIPRLRFLFTTLGYVETDFYARAGRDLVKRGHQVAHVTWSRRAANALRRRGETAWCMPDLLRACPDADDLDAEAEALRARYGARTFRDFYRTDPVCEGRDETWCVDRTRRHLVALECVFDDWAPDVVVPEVGNETIRLAAHQVGLRRGLPVLFLLYTIFDDPLRLYVDTLHAPIVDPSDVRDPDPAARAAFEEFRRAFLGRRTAIREHRRSPFTARHVRMAARHLIVRATTDRDNDYLRPGRWLAEVPRERIRALAARRTYGPLPQRPFVYFPLHVTDDYKIKRVIPHCVDQASIVELVAASLPHGHELVIKEHPMSIGRTPPQLLRRLNRLANLTVVPPATNSHELIERSEAVAVISSTVGLEALLHEKPVLTIGEPFYSHLGLTLDLQGTADIIDGVPALMRFRPDPEAIVRILAAAMQRCLPGAPVTVDRSDANAWDLAGSLEQIALAEAGRRAGS